ncbi:MAG: hypothetical protein DI536_23000 [Archangium gephyra]|uniref:Big-1 domain-containing protein n=1 Tax=Archangium gephyra TaxID=48 RepID=A0A2W5TCI8_9BACT|nr:MAG: hypothetical protein DI536_23000 [Archangium gephyra]
MRRLSLTAVFTFASLFSACEPQKVEPILQLTPSPRTIDGNGQKSTVRVFAVDSAGKPGTGTVAVTSSLGSLKDGVELTLAEGAASAVFECDRATDPTCAGTVKLTGTWNGLTAEATVTIGAAPVDAGIDAGVDAGIDAGMMLGDAGVAVTTDKTQLIAGIGDSAVITAVFINNGAPAANESLTFSTMVGRLGPVGGAAVGTSFVVVTDGNGRAQAQLLADGTATGQALVRVTSDDGQTGTTSVVIVNVTQVSYISTTCPQTATNCNLMGLQNSGFNETAQLKFRVSDNVNVGVPGVPVAFSLINAPAGTTVEPMAVTNALGEVSPTVRAGTTVGTFSVYASVLNNTLSVTSPTIGVRGAKASNRGFTLRCDRVNLATLASPNPPLPLTQTCTVGLVDRYGNPVGTGTQVRLNSEAGTVPNNVTTQPFAPGNPSEGIGSFTFQTIGTYPPLDVPPFPADATQYPFPRASEPSRAEGPLTKNPRDGVVTIIAYLQGEEDFRDDNSNGVRDGTEQFIDQGEPFVDRNDNNMWDVGEFFVDTPPSDGGLPNGIWDGPNGVWDSNAQIWAEFKLLYTGEAGSEAGTNCVLNEAGNPSLPNSYGTLGLLQTKTIPLLITDDNLNRVEAGSFVGVRFAPQARGGVQLMSVNTGLDGYGFGYERRLVSADLTSDCSTTEPRCVWRSIFGGWQSPIGSAQLTGAAPPEMPVAQTLTVETTTRGIVTTCLASGIVQ